MMHTIPCSVTGRFYPANACELKRRVRGYLASDEAPPSAEPPVAIIAPHAAYDYCGAVAGAAYAPLSASLCGPRRVLLLGTWHRRGARGICTTSAEIMDTPLGRAPIDRAGVEAAHKLLGPAAVVNDAAHAADHALQVQLPFLQVVLNRFTVVPLLVGQIDARHVAGLIARLGAADESLVVVSSDLSHFLDDATARRVDGQTAEAIVQLNPAAIGPQQACGYSAVRGLLLAAADLGWTARVAALGNSGRVSQHNDRVVGYGAFCFEEDSDRAA